MTNQQFEEWVEKSIEEFKKLQWELGDKTWQGFGHESYQKPIEEFFKSKAHAIKNKVLHEAIEALPEKWSEDFSKDPDAALLFAKPIRYRNEAIDESKQSLLNLLTKE